MPSGPVVNVPLLQTPAAHVRLHGIFPLLPGTPSLPSTTNLYICDLADTKTKLLEGLVGPHRVFWKTKDYCFLSVKKVMTQSLAMRRNDVDFPKISTFEG